MELQAKSEASVAAQSQDLTSFVGTFTTNKGEVKEATLNRISSDNLAALASVGSQEPQLFDIKEGGAVIPALSYGSGDHVLIILPGAKVNSRSDRFWMKSIAEQIANESLAFKTLSISWFEESDVAAAIRYAREGGARKVSLLGYSAGSGMVGLYSRAHPEEGINTAVLIASIDDQGIPFAVTKKLFIHSKADSIGKWTVSSYEKSPDPKDILILERGGHSLKDFTAERPTLISDIVAVLNR